MFILLLQLLPARYSPPCPLTFMSSPLPCPLTLCPPPPPTHLMSPLPSHLVLPLLPAHSLLIFPSSLPSHLHVLPLLFFLLLLALPSSPVCVFSYFWVWDVLWNMMNRPGVTWLKRSEVLFPRSSQIPIAPKLGVGLCLVWASTVFVHVVAVSLWGHKCICLLCMENS